MSQRHGYHIRMSDVVQKVNASGPTTDNTLPAGGRGGRWVCMIAQLHGDISDGCESWALKLNFRYQRYNVRGRTYRTASRWVYFRAPEPEEAVERAMRVFGNPWMRPDKEGT